MQPTPQRQLLNSAHRFRNVGAEIDRGYTYALIFSFNGTAVLTSGRHRLAALMARGVPQVMIIPEWLAPGKYSNLELILSSITSIH